MAPALSIAPREPHIHDTNGLGETERPQALRRRALTSVDNLVTHMDEDDMGLQNQPSLAKDSQEMEQILVDLGSTELEQQGDLLQAIKTMDTGADALSGGEVMSTDDPEAIFPLSGFESLPEPADSEGDAMEEKIKTVQVKLERRCSFLQRRLRILQARAIGKKVSEEATQSFEKCTRGARRDSGGGRHMGLKTFLKTVETTSALQASAQSRAVVGPKYYNPGTSKGDASKSASIGIPSGTLTGLEDTAGALRSHLSVVKHELDSDATLSSSGAESNDEAVTYNNPLQQQMPIEKRALWSWQRKRASIASRWCWLQAQVQELEYRIRQHNELHAQVRENKGPVEFEGEPVAYEGSLPGSEPPDDHPSRETCARVRPLRRETFKKRKLLQMHNLHIATQKAAKPSDINCSCEQGMESCAVCTGRVEPTQPAPPLCTVPPRLRIAAVDPGFHPVLSDIKDVPASVHMSALAPRAWFRSRVGKSWRGAHGAPPRPTHAASSAHTPKPLKRHPTRSKRGRPPLTKKIRERERNDETSTSGHERSRGRSSTESRGWRRQSYDIDNIVIPQSVAANTRPQILTYKEIITPKWRVLEIPDAPLNNGISKSNRMSIESEEEDVSDAAVSLRHTRAEGRERARYMRKRRARRDTQEQNSHHEQPPLPAPTPPPSVRVPDPTLHETVRPYTPRQFPLGDAAYQHMVAAMPDGFHSPASPPPADSDTSSLSPADVTPFDGDDPDDAEWDPRPHRSDRRKSSFR
nr:KAT8 regulatory NSL complex subunit 1 [Helicoverpa armigera]XP_049703534.1 KAT8 regulatory NSL complex subunit 1 [Helicoverpa armigera]XP_049703535.1 KAT8 regulatory NSL complex subunit 1 [Helicoverpa armigera]XP_049703536.1 KAT8 regulatory NSL complex subunit 1 [Helicoverpa armigera]XP_049703537.1 KAT8 regulatory NSL complex subunit 1 [Helicoverpa armigera]XP_049703538.1 KAT8 regulatory NSL complex subunit 1 [Helicoverpa armigera]